VYKFYFCLFKKWNNHIPYLSVSTINYFEIRYEQGTWWAADLTWAWSAVEIGELAAVWTHSSTNIFIWALLISKVTSRKSIPSRWKQIERWRVISHWRAAEQRITSARSDYRARAHTRRRGSYTWTLITELSSWSNPVWGKVQVCMNPGDCRLSPRRPKCGPTKYW